MNTTLEILKQKLEEPAKTFRPLQIIHGKYPKNAEDTKKCLDIAEQNGMGGFVVNMDYVPERLDNETDEEYDERRLDGYLGIGKPEYEEEWMHLKRFIEACFDRGFNVWIYDELKYPSGAAGNKVLKGDPDYQVKGLVCKSLVTNEKEGVLDGIDGDVLYAAAYRVCDDGLLDADCPIPVEVKDGKAYYSLPEGSYRVCVFYTKKLAFLTENVVPYPDLMRADVIDKFIDVTYEQYYKHLGADIISRITAFFTDEPSLPTHGCSQYFDETGAICAWTEELCEIFPSLDKMCVDIFFDTKHSKAPYDVDIRRSYWQEADRIFAQNYFGRIAKWCEDHGTRLTGHLYGEETLGMQIGLNAGLFNLYRQMQMPGVDRLYCYEPRDVIPEKTATSAAHLYGLPYVMSENSFHFEFNFWNMKENATVENRINSAYYQMQLGLTHISSYFPYSQYEYDEGWKKFNECASRASEFITTGTHKADVMILIPMEAAWEQYTPQDHKYWLIGPAIVAPYQHESLQVLEKAYGESLLRLQNARIDYDLIDTKGLSECVIDKGVIKTPYESFTHLVIFDSGSFDEITKANIEKFLASGGTVTAVSSIFPTKECAEWKEKYGGSFVISDYEAICDSVLSSNAKAVIEITAPDTVRVRKSETDDAQLWFIHNRADACKITINEKGTFTIMYADRYGCETVVSDGSFSVDMEEKSAIMLVREK